MIVFDPQIGGADANPARGYDFRDEHHAAVEIGVGLMRRDYQELGLTERDGLALARFKSDY